MTRLPNVSCHTVCVALLPRATGRLSVSTVGRRQTACRVYSCHVAGRLQAFGGCACHFMTTDPPTYGLPAVLAAMRMDRGYRWPACGPGQQGHHRVTGILVYLFIMFFNFFFVFFWVRLGMYFNSLFIGFIGCTHVPHPQKD